MNKLRISREVRVCSNCPFRKNAPAGWLGSKRMTEILEGVFFTCHKTIEAALGERATNKPCGGHVALGQNSLLRRLGATVKEADLDKLFENDRECIEHHRFLNRLRK
jgi:hypothetical protein